MTSVAKAARGVLCPFCGDDGYDLHGLKGHLQGGRCEAFEATTSIHEMTDEEARRLVATEEAATVG